MRRYTYTVLHSGGSKIHWNAFKKPRRHSYLEVEFVLTSELHFRSARRFYGLSLQKRVVKNKDRKKNETKEAETTGYKELNEGAKRGAKVGQEREKKEEVDMSKYALLFLGLCLFDLPLWSEGIASPNILQP